MSSLLKITISAALLTFTGIACDTQPTWGDPWDGPEPEGAGSPALGEEPGDDAPAREPAADEDDEPATSGPLDPDPEPEPDGAGTGGIDDNDGDLPPAEPMPEGIDESGDGGIEGDPECDGVGFFAESYTDCEHDEVFARGCCWSDFAASCEALGCAEGECFALTSVPMQAACVAHE